MFTGFEEKNLERVKLVDVDPDALEVLVEYVYSSEVDVTESNVQVLLPAANLLQLMDVRDACCEFLTAQLHPTNALGIKVQHCNAYRPSTSSLFSIAHNTWSVAHSAIFCSRHLPTIMAVQNYKILPTRISKVTSPKF